MASRLLQWLAPSVEIKGRKVLGQVEAWPKMENDLKERFPVAGDSR